MQTGNSLKELVKQKYSKIALEQTGTNAASCCGTDECYRVTNIMTDDYTKLEGYNPAADLGLGCGLPTQFANIKKGDTVIDLGSGAGNDCFIARKETGESGTVIGIDFTPAMIALAICNAEKLSYTNIEFRLGDIEHLPLESNIADVIVSNCVLNLVPDKEAVIREIYRTLKSGGHFCISDIVVNGNLPASLRTAAEMYAGCVSGAIQKEFYLDLIANNGFQQVTILQEKSIIIPDDILANYLSGEQINEFRESKTGIVSITIYGEKR